MIPAWKSALHSVGYVADWWEVTSTSVQYPLNTTQIQ